MKKNFIIILYLISILSVTNAQNGYFNNVYLVNNNTVGRSITKDDSNYVALSISQDTAGYNMLNFCRFDHNSNLIFSKNFGEAHKNYFTGYSGNIHKTYDGNFIICGGIQDTIGYGAVGYLLKVTPNFDTIFLRKFVDTIYNYLELEQSQETSDKGFILCGGIASGAHNQCIILIKTDSLGNQIFRKTYTLEGVDDARNVIQTPDKGYLLGCYSWNYYSASYSGDPWVLKLDSLGNLEWSRKLGGPNQDGSAIVALANDSNYIVATAYAYSTIPGNSSDLKIEVLKIDNYNNIIWDKQYDTIRTFNYPNMIKVLENDNILVVGSTFFGDGVNWYTTSWVLKLKPNGDSIYYKLFYKFNDSYTIDNTANDFCINADNSIVICGDVTEANTYQMIWLVGMDSMGCIQPGCDPTGIVELKYTKQEMIRVYPNPATNQTTIAYSQLKEEGSIHIYNMLGQMVYEEKIVKGTMQTNLNIQNYKAGLYKVIVREKGMMIGEVSLVKE